MKRTTWFGTCLLFLCFSMVGIVVGRLHGQDQPSAHAQAPVGTHNFTFLGTPVPTEAPPKSEQPQTEPGAVQRVPVNPEPDPPTTKQLQDGLKTIRWTFTPVDPTQIAGVITQEQALARIQKRTSDLQQEAVHVTAHLGTLQNMALQQTLRAGGTTDSPFAQPRLVWLVTLSGVGTVSSGPPEHVRTATNEMNVAVDALTGEYLMDFVWTR